MYYSINGGNVSFGGENILEDIHFEIKNKEKIAVVGRNGCGKTTLLRLINGEIDLETEQCDRKVGISVTDDTKIGYLKQITFSDDTVSLETEVKKAFSGILQMKSEMECLVKEMENDPSEEKAARYTAIEEHFKLLGGYYYQKEYEMVVKNFGFSDEDKKRPLSTFSGGQRTKIAFVKLLLSKPDILLLDEPTNHLDMETVEWLEGYIKSYPTAVVIVSHDQMFLDRTADIVYEIEYSKIKKYLGNYSSFTLQKKQEYERRKKEYEAQQKEIARIEELVERFRYKANKASMAQSKIKYLERMELIAPPQRYDMRSFFADAEPAIESGNNVLEVKNLEIGYDKTLSKVSFNLLKGQKLGIIGGNGLGKSTLLKTIMGKVSSKGGYMSFGVNVRIGYFDQQMAQYSSSCTVLDDYWNEFPNLTQTEARSDLGAFLFRGEDVFKTVDVLSGGEKVRLALCKIFKRRPNLLILDEPTNHMDIVGKESLEEMLKDFSGTVLCVSHDRYFIKELCDCLLVFEEGQVKSYPFGFEQYEQQKQLKPKEITQTAVAVSSPQVKEKHFSPLKELSKVTKKLDKTEEKIALLEEEIGGIKTELSLPEVATDYLKISEISKIIEEKEATLSGLYGLWEELSVKKEELSSKVNVK